VTFAAEAQRRARTPAPLDRRLWGQAHGVRALLAASVASGLGLVGCLVAQAFFLAGLLARLFDAPVRLHDLAYDFVGLALASLARALLVGLSATIGARAANKVRTPLRRRALQALLAEPPAQRERARTGELAVDLGPGLDALDVYVADYLPRLVLAVLAPVALLGVIGVLDWVSCVIVLVALGVVAVFMVLIGHLTKARAERRMAALGALGAHFLEAVEGLATLRAYGRARRQEAQIAEVTDDLRRATLAVLRQTFLSALVLETLAAVGTALVAVPLALRLLDGHARLASALTILILTPEVFLPLRRASADFHAAADGLSALERVATLVEDDLDGSPAGRGMGARSPLDGKTTLPGLRDAGGACLRLTGVRLSYPGRSQPVLEGVDLHVRPGERVVLTGASGTGKSSLLAALVALLPLDAGSIALGDMELGQLDPELWRAHFAYLPQRPRLFSGTLADNLCLGQAGPGSHDLEDRLGKAIEVAQLAELVAELPGGLHASIGEAGSRLSTGERQRVALARALARHDATVVVLDEPTAHLDATTEARLVKALDAWLEGRSLLLASHRPRLVELADRVVTLEAGRIAHPSSYGAPDSSKRPARSGVRLR
jgi:thiol reductant ABC exporter CydD subunit